jgi:hypothetical protein
MNDEDKGKERRKIISNHGGNLTSVPKLCSAQSDQYTV